MKPLTATALVWLAASCSAALGAPAAEGAHVLFDAGRDAPSAVRHYTAGWIKGSELEPVAKRVTKDGRAWIEVRYRGRRGTACSTFRVGEVPCPPAGRTWNGLALVIACDRRDYPTLRVSCAFADKTILVKRLHLERGTHTYPVARGFRRADTPPPWDRLAHVMLRVEAGGGGNDLVFRLGSVRLASGPAPPPPPDETADDLLGTPLIWPRPKRAAWRNATCETAHLRTIHLPADATDRTALTAAILADDLLGYTGVRPETRRFKDDPPAEGIVLGVAARTAAFGEPTALESEGYHLAIEPDRIAVTGADEAGLYYGTVTLMQLVRGARHPRPAVPCGEVVDAPSWPNRLARLSHPWTFRNHEICEDRGIAYLMDWVDRYVAGLKFNTLFIDVSALVRFERRPEFNGSERIYSLDDLRRLARLAKDRFVRLCPALAVGGHANHWLLRYHPELTEKGWPRQADVTHPKHDAIVFDCVRDLLDAFDPAYFSPKGDEWWHTPARDDQPEPTLGGRPHAEAFLEVHRDLARLLRERGVRMMVYHDMLTPFHNGKRHNVYKTTGRFPAETIINLWSPRHADRDLTWFRRHGLAVWPNATHFWTLSDENEQKVIGFGQGLYGFGHEKRGLRETFSDLQSMGTLIAGADYCWNRACPYGPRSEHAAAVRMVLAADPNPHAGRSVAPLDLAGHLSDSLAGVLKQAGPQASAAAGPPVALPRGRQEVGGVPMHLAEGPKDCLALGEQAKPVALPVGRQAASLLFLHTAAVDNPDDPRARDAAYRKWMYGWPCGHYVVAYADGETATLPVRLTDNVRRFNAPHPNRATNRNRYVWSLPDAAGGRVHLFQWEWVNPRPAVPIAQVTVQPPRELDVTLVLLAVSARAAADAVISADGHRGPSGETSLPEGR